MLSAGRWPGYVTDCDTMPRGRVGTHPSHSTDTCHYPPLSPYLIATALAVEPIPPGAFIGALTKNVL
jgi:hypothetical protein